MNRYLLFLTLLYFLFISCDTKLKTHFPSGTALFIFTSDKYEVLGFYKNSSDKHIQLLDLNGKSDQQWKIEKAGRKYIIRSVANNKVLAINSNLELIIEDYDGKIHQKWIITGNKDSVRIKNAAIHKYLVFSRHLTFENYRNKFTQNWKLIPFQEFQQELDSCNCAENFKFIKEHIETSYSGFHDKVNPETKHEYDSLSTLTHLKVQKTSDPFSCYILIHNYLSFFKDKHIHFRGIYKEAWLENNNKITAEWFNLKHLDDSTLLFSMDMIIKKRLMISSIRTGILYFIPLI